MTVNVLDSELPFLASQAAVEIDSLLNGTYSEITAVKQLAERLNSTLGGDAPSSSQRSLAAAETATVAILGQAWNQSRDKQHPVTNVNELASKTADIADKLAMVTPGNNDPNLQWMRAYCLALSRCAAAYRKSVFDIQRPHPYRR
jgi:hypothetical protein